MSPDVIFPGVFDYKNNNNNNNNNNSDGEKERRQEDEMMATKAPVSPEADDEQSDAACSVTSASPMTPDSSPRDCNLSLLDDSYKLETSTPLKHDSGDVDADSAHLGLCHSADLVDRGSERSSAASDYGTPSYPCFPDTVGIYQPYSTLKTSPFLSTSSPVKSVAGLGSVRCPPVREAVDPAKYITISGEPDGVKYACSKCGNIYKWRKSLNKHWKEKHDGEAPDPAAVSAAANRYVRLPTPVAANRPSPAGFSSASSSATRPIGVRGSLAAILPPSGGGLGLRHSPVNGRGWNQPDSIALQSQQLKTPTFADYKTSSSVSASPFSVLAVDSVSSKERPVDLSGSISRAQNNNDGLDYGGMVLDLSKKGVAPYVSQSSSVQDEPLDFSTKTVSHAVRNPINESGLYQTTFAGRSLEQAHAGYVTATTSLNCAQCRQKFTIPSKLNRHFAEAHSDILHVTAATADGDAGEVGFGGSTQLYHYLTTDHSATREAIRCVVCGSTFYQRSAVAKHFDQEHVGLCPNPYQLSVGAGSDRSDGHAASSTQRRPTTGVDQQLPGAGNQLRCGRCPFTTDSFSVLARHHLRHSSRRPNDLMAPEMSHIWSGTGGRPGNGDDVKVAELQFLSEAAVNMDENTAIVIPQAPEETAPTAVASSSKPFKHTSSGARSSGGRGKRSDAGGSSTASAETLLPFKCELCEYRARWPSEMTQHAKNHSDEKPYHCPQCTYRSKWKWDVVKHLKRCGGGGTARDVIDTTNQSTSTSSSSAVTAVTSAASQTARRRRTNVRSLLIDVPTAHTSPSYERGPGSVTENSTQPSAATTALSSTGVSRENLSNGPPNVMVCYRMQDSGSDRTPAHGVVQTDADAVTIVAQSKSADSASPTPPAVSLVNQGLHYCLQCSFVGHSPAELRRHLRVHSDEKPYSCRTCCYSSKWKCDLKKHLRAYNHVSAVPLAYGGHGRKPTSDWQTLKDGLDVAGDDELSGPMDDGDDVAGDVSATPDSGSQVGAVSSLKSDVRDDVLTKSEKMPNGSNFAGITVGGRLRCRRCDFEAIDLTSFLQHKSTHASVPKDKNGDAGDDQGLQTPATAAARPSHHRRKSSKQVRVLPENKTDNCINKTLLVVDQGFSINNNKLPNNDQENLQDAVDGSKFWKSLGLRSKNGVSCLKSSESMVGNGASALDMAVDSHKNEQQTTVIETEITTAAPRGSQSPYDADVHEIAEVAADAVTPSPSSSSSDTDVEYADDDQPVNLCRRASPNVTKLDAEILTDPVASQAAKQMSNVAERITTTEADDASGLSKRKRKLRTCDKCGYVTDNLTTLQRHAAKHGSAGR